MGVTPLPGEFPSDLQYRRLESSPALESNKADVFCEPPDYSRFTGRQVQLRVEESIRKVPTCAPRSTSGRAPFTGQLEAK